MWRRTWPTTRPGQAPTISKPRGGTSPGYQSTSTSYRAELFVGADDREALGHRLGDEEAIEGVAMVVGQGRDSPGVLRRDFEPKEALLDHGHG